MPELGLSEPLDLGTETLAITNEEHAQIAVVLKELLLVSSIRYAVQQHIPGQGMAICAYSFKLANHHHILDLVKREHGWDLSYPAKLYTGTLDEQLERLKRWVLSKS